VGAGVVAEMHRTGKTETSEGRVDVKFRPGFVANGLALAISGQIGAAGGTGHAIEFGGEAVRSLSMEGRMTLCNMSIEAGARSGMVAVDETTIQYLKNRPMAPSGADWDLAVKHWRELSQTREHTLTRPS